MQIDRRRFLQFFAAAAAGSVLDPERLLWVPGQKKIFLPPAPTITTLWSGLQVGDIINIEGQYVVRSGKRLQDFVVTWVDSSTVDLALHQEPAIFAKHSQPKWDFDGKRQRGQRGWNRA